MAKLFESLTLRKTTFKNRIVVSPMCQYSATDGVPNNWHLVHLGSRAVGGAGLILAEATGVTPEGRISPGCTGLWNDTQLEAWKPIVNFIQEQGSLAGIQLAHAGRKGSTGRPWDSEKVTPPNKGGWTPVAPSPLAYDDQSLVPHELSKDEIQKLQASFVSAAQRALKANFDVLEIHAAHGYLAHEFLSPLSNTRTDEYGGSFENRIRFLLEISSQVRSVWPQDRALFVRISATDWVEAGWDLSQSLELCKKLKEIGVDLIDVSSGGLSPLQQLKVEANYQVPFSEKIRRETALPTGAVGMICDPEQAEKILLEGKADLIFLAREFLREPYWSKLAAQKLGVKIPAPKQYLRAW
jgi:2,4-dienoyl-CoA reductase-like NADH-dependent reductase (Old Yellow Enzyme family)